jgi:DNA-binding transcriptional LysR family regulator
MQKHCEEREFTLAKPKPKAGMGAIMKRVSDIDLRLLRVFVVVAEAEGFAAAEATLNVSTSTISVHVSNLEARLGVRLCERGRAGFSLTEHGKIVYEETKRMLTALDDFAGTLASARKLLAGRLVIGMCDSMVSHADFPLPDAIREFNKIENEVEFELVVNTIQGNERDVLSGKLHAAIGPYRRKNAGLQSVPLFYEPHDLYCGEGHALFNAPPRDIARADFAEHAAVVRPYHTGFDGSSIGIVREEATVNTMEGVLTLLLSGGYIGFLPRHYAQPWVDAGKLFPINRARQSYISEHHVITRKTGRKPAALGEFVAILERVARSHPRSEASA